MLKWSCVSLPVWSPSSELAQVARSSSRLSSLYQGFYQALALPLTTAPPECFAGHFTEPILRTDTWNRISWITEVWNHKSLIFHKLNQVHCFGQSPQAPAPKQVLLFPHYKDLGRCASFVGHHHCPHPKGALESSALWSRSVGAAGCLYVAIPLGSR